MSTPAATEDTLAAAPPGWASALPDLAAFAAGLGMAWYFGWRAADLVWSLWLSSLLVGYLIIAWGIFGPAITDFAFPPGREEALGTRAAQAGIRIFGGLFLLAFFTVHFGFFHYVHSVLLNAFFPLMGPGPRVPLPTRALYIKVLRDYWPFLFVMAVAERDAFRLRRGPAPKGGAFMAAYQNVLRMHMLIFFFALAHFAKFENIVVYATVYAVYFFPWRLVRRRAAPVLAESPGEAAQR